MTASRLLKSCATPPVRRPSASIFWLCCAMASAAPPPLGLFHEPAQRIMLDCGVPSHEALGCEQQDTEQQRAYTDHRNMHGPGLQKDRSVDGVAHQQWQIAQASEASNLLAAVQRRSSGKYAKGIVGSGSHHQRVECWKRARMAGWIGELCQDLRRPCGQARRTRRLARPARSDRCSRNIAARRLPRPHRRIFHPAFAGDLSWSRWCPEIVPGNGALMATASPSWALTAATYSVLLNIVSGHRVGTAAGGDRAGRVGQEHRLDLRQVASQLVEEAHECQAIQRGSRQSWCRRDPARSRARG